MGSVSKCEQLCACICTQVMTSNSSDCPITTERRCKVLCCTISLKGFMIVSRKASLFIRIYLEALLDITWFIKSGCILLFSSWWTTIRIEQTHDMQQNKPIKLHLVKIIRKKKEAEKRNKKIRAMNYQEEYDMKTRAAISLFFFPLFLDP